MCYSNRTPAGHLLATVEINSTEARASQTPYKSSPEPTRVPKKARYMLGIQEGDAQCRFLKRNDIVRSFVCFDTGDAIPETRPRSNSTPTGEQFSMMLHDYISKRTT